MRFFLSKKGRSKNETKRIHVDGIATITKTHAHAKNENEDSNNKQKV